MATVSTVPRAKAVRYATATVPARRGTCAGPVFLHLVLAGLVIATGGCTKTSEPAAAPTTATNHEVYTVKGVVKAVLPRQKQIEIAHEEVPGFMPAMTMPFDVRDTNELAGLAPGQAVSFRLTVAETEAWIDQIQKLGPPSTNSTSTPPAGRVREVEPLDQGDLLPERHFTNQFGQTFSTSDFKGQAVAITFLFTRCPYPTYCPKMAAGFQAVQERLLATRPALTNWHLLAVSFDPEFDTPAVLKAYAQSHGYNPRHWSFATGALIDIVAISEQFGLAFWREPSGSISHNLRTAVIDAGGRVHKIFEGNTWTSDELADELVLAAGKR